MLLPSLVQPFLLRAGVIGFVILSLVTFKPFWSNWFLLIVVLVYLGGVMVLVMYVSCLGVSSREWVSLLRLAIILLVLLAAGISQLEYFESSQVLIESSSNFEVMQAKIGVYTLLYSLGFLLVIIVYRTYICRQNQNALRYL